MGIPARNPQEIREELIASGKLIPRHPHTSHLAHLLTALNSRSGAIMPGHRGRFARNSRRSLLALRGGADFQSKDGKAWHALGYSVGRTFKMSDLQECSTQEIEDIVSGIQAALAGQAPKIPLEENVKKAGQVLQERKD